MKPIIQILLVEDDQDLRQNLEALLQDLGHAVVAVSSAEEGLEEVKFRATSLPFDLLLMDIKLPGMSGLEMLRQVRATNPLLACVLMTAHGNIPDAVEAIQLGALSYLEKPVDMRLVDSAITKAVQSRNHLQALLISDPHTTPNESRESLSADTLIRLAQSQAPLLLLGPSGSGKLICSRALHSLSTQRQGGFLNLNAIDLTPQKIFGDATTPGTIQELNRGTLFIRNVENLNEEMQALFLHLLETGHYEVSSSLSFTHRQVPAQTRLHFSTTLSREALAKSLEPQFFEKISRFSLFLSPLQPRISANPQCLSQIVEYFISALNQKHSLKIRGVRESALKFLSQRNWPGNLRELEAALERAMIFESSELLSAQSFNPNLMRAEEDRTIDYHAEKEKFERDFIVQALRRFDGRINQTVLKAGIPKNTLLRKIRKYSIEPREYGTSAEAVL